MSTYTPSLGLELITPGSQAGLWGNTTNNSLTLIDQAITGVTPISFASASGTTYTLTDYNGAEDESRAAVLNITGTATGANTVVIPNKQKTYLVRNNTGQDVTFQTASPTATYVVGAGYSILIFCDGNNNVFTGIASPGVGTLSVNAGGTGATTFTAGFVKSTGGTNALTSASAVSLSSEVTGTLPVSNGGTGVTSFTSGGVLIGNGSGNLATVTASTTGYVLTWNGSTWVAAAAASGGVTSIFGTSPIVVTGTTTPTISLSTVPVASGGTGNTSWTSGGAVYASGSTTLTSGTLPLTAGGTGATSASSALANLGGGSLTATQTWSGTNTFSTTPSSSLVGAVNISQGGASAPTLRLYNATGGDTERGGEIQMTNLNAASNVRNKYIRVSQVGTLQVVNSGYTAGILILDNDGNFTVNGNITTTNGEGYKPGGGTWAAYSDSRLKENAQPLSGALEKISSLNPVTYQWKYNTIEPTVGFLAQEVKQVIPTAVSDVEPNEHVKHLFQEDETVMSIGWKNDMMAYLVGAIKELKAEIDALKAAK